MSAFLPDHARAYIDSDDLLGSIQKLTTALEAGDIDLSVLKGFVNAKASGNPIRFQKTKPVSLRMLDEIRNHPHEEPRRVIYRGLHEGLWTYDDVERWEQNNEVLSTARKTSVSKGTYLTRKRRARSRLMNVSDQFVPKLALDVVCKHDLPDGAKACLALLLSLAGKKSDVVTYTSSLATMLGRTPRTVRNYYVALEECGLIERRPGRHPNTVHIRIADHVRPAPYVEPKDVAAYKLASRSSNPVLREMAETVVAFSARVHSVQLRPDEGRKVISAFNPLLNPIGPDEECLRRPLGATTHSNFVPTMTTNRNAWNRRNSGIQRTGDGASSRLKNAPCHLTT